jgi:hypothetical protein
MPWQTTPAIAFQSPAAANQARTRRVKVNVIGHSRKVSTPSFYQHRFVTTLKQMAHLSMTPVVAAVKQLWNQRIPATRFGRGVSNNQ